MMLSKMKLDAGSVRVFAAILCGLIVQVCADEQQVPTDVEVPLTGMRLGSSVGMLVAAVGAHAVTYYYGKDVSTVWTYSSYGLSGFTFLVMIFEAVLGNYMAVPLYSSLFVLPYAAVLGAAVTGGVNKIGFMSKSGIFANLGNNNPNKPAATKTDIENAFKNKQGESAVKAMVKLSATNTIKFDDFIPETIAFIEAILAKDTEKTEFEGDNLDLVKAALKALKDKGQDLCNADSNSPEYKSIQAIFANSEAKLRIGKGKDPLHTFKKGEKKDNNKQDENVDYVAKLKEAIKAPKADTHCELIVDAWLAYNSAKGKKDDALLKQIKALYPKLVALLDVKHFPHKDVAEAAKNIVGLRKILKSLETAGKKDATNTFTYQALAVEDKTDLEYFAFGDEFDPLKVEYMAMFKQIVADKIAKDKDIKAYDLVTKAADADAYDDATVKSKFIVQFNKVMDLIKDDENITFKDVAEESVFDFVESHVTAVTNLIQAATGKNTDKKDKDAGKKLYESLKDVKTEKFNGLDLFKKDLMDLLTAVDPDGARKTICLEAVKASADVRTTKDVEVPALVNALITASKTYADYNDAKYAKETKPVLDEMVNVKKAITAAVDKLIALAATEENKAKLEAAENALKLADIPTAKVLDAAKGKDDESALKAELKKVEDRIAVVKLAIPLVEQIEKLKAALKVNTDARFGLICAAVHSAKAVYVSAAADGDLKKLKEFTDLKKELGNASKEILASVQKYSVLKGDKIPKTVSDLKAIRDIIQSITIIKKSTEAELGISDKDDAPYFRDDHEAIWEVEKESTKATAIALSTAKPEINAGSAKTMGVAELIKRAEEIIFVVPADKTLEDLKNNSEAGAYKTACEKLAALVGFIIDGVKHQCEEAAKDQKKSAKLVQFLVGGKIMAEGAEEYAGISMEKLDGTEDMLFKEDIDKVILKAKEE